MNQHDPNLGSQTYEQLGQKIGALVDRKNAAYGSSFHKAGAFLALLYENGLQPEQYVDSLALVRIFDKMMRIATDNDPSGESPYQDIAGYGLLGAQLHSENHTNKDGNGCGSANTDAVAQSMEPNASAVQPASEPTRTNASEPNDSSSSSPSTPPSESASANTVPAPAPTATEAAPSVVDALAEARERNRRNECANCGEPLTFGYKRFSTPGQYGFDACSAECRRPLMQRYHGEDPDPAPQPPNSPAAITWGRSYELLQIFAQTRRGWVTRTLLDEAMRARGLGELTALDLEALKSDGLIVHDRVRAWALTQHGVEMLNRLEGAEL